eukprot:CAMPEP_0115271884 /NCGR_PEP_ID=MMETSP0270-20121206/54336_1 /TAXON_ID=71861 /ORGANISM="Scrippsiella trochoidea, Strain CCMP3099" /LENGTH=333 /DNA_ID=CAMNT_0002688271 /DNA_START=118 /DNA_END=1119 /DNA_ORIENTATION=+
MAAVQMDFHMIYGQHQSMDMHRSGHVYNERSADGRFMANCGVSCVPASPIDDLRKRVAASSNYQSARVADAQVQNSNMQVFRRTFEEQAHCFRARMMSGCNSPLGLGTHTEVHNYIGVTPSHNAKMLNAKTATIQHGADDLFESVPLNADFPKETGNIDSPLPSLGIYEARQVFARAKLEVQPPPGLSVPSCHAGTGCMAGLPVRSGLAKVLYVHGTPSSVSCESLGEDWKHATHDSLSAVSTNSGAGEHGELEGSDVPKKKKHQRFCKAKRDRYRHLVEGLVEQAKDDPASFNLSEHQLPPGIASSEESKAKLLATVMKFAIMKFEMASAGY